MSNTALAQGRPDGPSRFHDTATAGPRVLHISSVYPPQVTGGAEKVVAQLAEAQAVEGMTVGAAYLVPADKAAGERNEVHTFPQTDRNLIWMEDVMRRPRLMRTANKLLQVVNLSAASDFERVIDAFRPDIVHTHSMVELPPHIWARAKRSGAAVVHTLHDYDLICSRASLFRDGHNCETLHPSCRILGSWKARFTRFIDAVVAVSAPVLEEHRRHGLFAHLPDRCQRVIWNAMPTETGRSAARSPLPADQPFTFGFLGRLVPEKGLEVLLKACRMLPPSGWQLRIAGRAPGDVAALQALAQGLPITFEGFVEPQAFLDGLDTLVVPSIWKEPFGLTVVEAFARGVPVLGADHGAIRDLVLPVGPDWLTPPGDDHALGLRMIDLLRKGRAMLPSRLAFRPTLDAVTPARMVDDYTLLYAHLRAQRLAA